MNKVLSRQTLIHLMEHRTSMSDPALEDVLIKVPGMRCFVGANSISKRIPDEVKTRQGRCINATLIAVLSPTSTTTLLHWKCF
jgi:hypothetical protein